jgi:hypothetical protein
MGSPSSGTKLRVPAARNIVASFLAQARKTPLAMVTREFVIPELIEARRATSPAVSWVTLFAKAYGIAGREVRELRRSWVSYPRKHLYEHPTSECSVIVEREVDGEFAILPGRVSAPEDRNIADVDREVRSFRDLPVNDVPGWKKLLDAGRAPGWLRWFAFWTAIHWSGRKRSNLFGTFLISSLGNLGADTTLTVMPLTGYLTFGPIAADGRVTVGLLFDHRVMDGRHAARALQEMERAMNEEILEELKLGETANLLV